MDKLGSFARVLLFDKAGVGLSNPVPKVRTLDDRAAEIGTHTRTPKRDAAVRPCGCGDGQTNPVDTSWHDPDCSDDNKTAMTRKPEISLYLRNFSDDPAFDWSATLDTARAMDAAGVDRVVVSDHLVFGENLDAYADPTIGGTAGGKQPTGPDGFWLDPLIYLTALAATTTRIRIGTAILLAALRRPAVLAKQLATMDVLSGGRVDLGVGVGWQREEYDAVGLSFEERGRLLDHTLEVCQTLWTEQRASYDSPELTFDGIHQMPKPLQPGGIPIWISGTVNKRVARRLSKFGYRWIPWGPAITDLEGAIRAMKQAIVDAGGDPANLQVQGTALLRRTAEGAIDVDASIAPVAQLVACGATEIRFTGPLPQPTQAVEQFSQLVTAFREVEEASGRSVSAGTTRTDC
jgi:probable F420-dependent oxidoreductase